MYTNSTGGLDNAQWGTICDDNWDIQDAWVVCHQLGYLSAVVTPLPAYYGEGTGPIWLSNVKCNGNESNLFACVHSRIGNHNCGHDQDVSIKCTSKSPRIIILITKFTYIELTHVHACTYVCTFNSCNIGMSVLPDMYTQIPRAAT